MSSKLTEVLKKLHGRSFSGLPFNNNDNAVGVNLDSIFPPTDGDASSNWEPSQNSAELKPELDEQDAPTVEDVASLEKTEDISEPQPADVENDVAASDNSVLSENAQECDAADDEECKNSIEAVTPPVDNLENEIREDVSDAKNDCTKAAADESNKKSRRKQQKTHRCVALDDSLLSSPLSDKHRSSIDGSSFHGEVDQSESSENLAKCELENLFDLPEGTVFVQPESVDTSPKVISLDTSRSKKIFRGGSLESAILHCTACNKQLGVDGQMDYHRHPMLKVLVCRKCYNWYISGEIEQDKDGTDEQCRWCRQGGDLICCDFCHNSFCKSCIRRNLGRKELSSILDTEDDFKWKCYVCDPKRLLGLIEHCSGVMEALAKQEKRQQEMDIKRKKSVKPNQVVASTAASCRTSNSVSTAVTSGAGSVAVAQQQNNNNDNSKPLNLKPPDRRNSDGRTEPRFIQPKPALNHSFPGLSSLTQTANRPASSITKSAGTSAANNASLKSMTMASTNSELNLKDLVVVENLISLTSNMESMLVGLLKESKKITANAPTSPTANSHEAIPGSSAESKPPDADSKMEAVARRLFRAQNLYLDSFRVVAEVNGQKSATSSTLKYPSVSILANQNKTQRFNAPTLVKDQNGKLVLLSKVASQSKPGTNRIVPLSGSQAWLSQSLTKVSLPQVLGQATQVQLASSRGKPTRAFIRIKPSSSAAAAAAIASGTIPLIVNDSKGQQKVVLAPIVVKPAAPKQQQQQPPLPPPAPIVIKPTTKSEDVLVISDTEEDGERTATVNLPEIIIHDVVVVEDGAPSQKQSGNSAAAAKANNQQVLTDKFLNQKEMNSMKKDDDAKSSFRQKRKKENDDDYAATDFQSKKLKEDLIVTSSPKKANQKEKTCSSPIPQQKTVSTPQDVVEPKTTSPKKVVPSPKAIPSEKKSEKLESKSQNSSSECDTKTPEPNDSQSEVKIPKKRGRKRKGEKADVQSKQLKSEDPSNANLRRSTRRSSLPMVVESNETESNKAVVCKQANQEIQADKVKEAKSSSKDTSSKEASNKDTSIKEASSKETSNKDTSNKETNNNGSNVSNHSNKKSQKKEDTSPKSSSIRTRRSLASIPDNHPEVGGATPRVTRATTNRKSSGC